MAIKQKSHFILGVFILFLLLGFTWIMNLSAVYADNGTNPVYADGTYEGTGQGRNGEIALSVTIENGVISGIQVISQAETPNYWENAKALLDTITENNSVDVDVVSGATLSSKGIKAAVSDALQKAENAAAGAWYESGDGTARNPYIILTAKQLQGFAVKVDDGETFGGKYVVLGADIDLSGIDSWNPIGAEGKASQNSGKLFAGSFDGSGHTVSGMTIIGEYDSEANIGLFSTLANTARVSNIYMTDVNISVSEVGSLSAVRAGSIAGDTQRGSSRAAE